MRKRIVETLISILVVVLGFYLFYLNLSDPENISILSMVISLTLIGIGIVMLFMTGRHDHSGIFLEEVKHEVKERTILDKNKDIIHSFQKHSKMRDKLKAIRHIK